MIKLGKFIATSIATISLTTTFAICTEFNSFERTGTLPRDIDEASGLTASALKKNMYLWTNDSGGASAIFATDLKGSLKRRVSVKGFSNQDYEALESGPCPTNLNEKCLYIGDIGDGIGWRSRFKMGIFKEKDFWTSKSISPISVINYRYPRGAENSEAFIVTKDADIVIFSKDKSGVTNLYKIKASSERIESMGSLDLNKIIAGARGKGPRVTDASYSAKNDRILILTYGDIIEADAKMVLNASRTNSWRNGRDYQIIKAPKLPQKETLTYMNNSENFIVSSENADGGSPGIFSYQCK